MRTRQVFRSSQLRRHSRKIIFNMAFRKIGDGIIFTGLFKILSEHGFKVYVIARQEVSFLYRENHYVAGVYDYKKIKQSVLQGYKRRRDIIKQMGLNDFDIMIDLISHPNLNELIKIMYAFKAKHRIVINSDDIIDGIADHHIRFHNDNLHMSQRSLFIMDYLQIKGALPNYQIQINQNHRQKALQLLMPFKNKFILCLNPYASLKSKSFNDKQIDSLLTFLSSYENIITVVIGEQKMIATIATDNYPRVIINKDPSFFVAAAIVKMANLVITPDTSIVHLCRALDKKLICYYPGGYQSNVLWGPFYRNATQIISERGVSICQMPISSILDPVKRELDKLLNE